MKRAKLTTFAVAFAVLFAFASPASALWKEKALYSFQGLTDGSTPVGGVVFDSAGNLYGATTDGGSATCQSIYQCGTVYQLAPPAQKGGPWTETVLYVFQGSAKNDGASPFGGLVMDSAGNLYGSTAYGGTGNCVLLGSKVGCGAVYELSPPTKKGGKWTENILYSFPSSKYGYVPRGSLVFDGAGNLFGATIFGGGHGTTCDPFYQFCGAVFELSRPTKKGGKWTEKVLHGFRGGSDGAQPNGGLILDSQGAVYGTTELGGYECAHHPAGCGTVFKLAPPTVTGGNWTKTILHRFKAAPDGATPVAGLTLDGKGNLFGTTEGGGGGNSGSGTVFRLAPRSDGTWKEQVLYSFQFGNDGADPMAGVVFDALGNLYGTAMGGVNGAGIVFRLKPPSKKGEPWKLAILYALQGSPDGLGPTANLLFDNNGNLYSTTQSGGTHGSSCFASQCGTMFEVSPQ